MHLSVTLCISLFLSFISLYGQDSNSDLYGYVVYKCYRDSVAFEENLRKLERENPQQFAMMGNHARGAGSIMELISFDLYFNSHKSYSTGNDEVDSGESIDVMQLKMAKIMMNSESVFSRDIMNKVNLTEISIDGGVSFIHVTEPFNKYDWKISPLEQKKIGNYLCRKATSTSINQTQCCGNVEKTIVAWFTTELPFSFGPMGYDGLPGLILEVSTGGKVPFVYRVSNIQIEKESSNDIPELRKPTKTLSQEELDEMLAARINRFQRN